MNRAPMILAASLLAATPMLAQEMRNPEVSPASRSAVSRPVKELPIHRGGGPQREQPEPKKFNAAPDGLAAGKPDPVMQTLAATPIATGVNAWDGVGVGGGYTPDAAPPDTNGAVGGPVVNGKSSQYVQWVNEAFAVYDTASGSVVSGPTLGKSLFSALGGYCAQYNDGDPIAQWDKINHRWIMTQFAVSQGASAGYRQCVAVSVNENAAGAYNLYEFSYGTNFNDYPKVGVGSDGNYYVTYNMFKRGRSFAGGQVCTMNGPAMRAGTAATQQCFNVGTSYGGLLPADLDRAYADAAVVSGDEPVMNFGTNSLNFWSFHADFANTANTKLTGPTNIAVPAFSKACGGGTCIPQPGTSQQLDSLADRLMYRLAYRQSSTGDSMMVNHSVTAGSSTGVRWYELRKSGSTWSVAYSGTWAPDSSYRWMGSLVMDKVGNTLLGYSVSSSTVAPDVRFATRAANASGFGGELGIVTSARGSQQATLARWGDYSAMSIDPADGCTAYFTTEYLQSNGKFNWSTRIGQMKAGNCN